MLVSSMHTQFKLGVDKADSSNSPNFLVEEVDQYLSDAQEEFIEQRAYGNNFKRETVEQTQKRVKDLQSITRNANIVTFVNNTDNKPNGTFVKLPTNYRHALEEEVTITYTDCNNQTQTARVKVIALQHDKYNNTINNPFTKPSLQKVYRLPYGRMTVNNVTGEYFELILAPGQTLVTYHLRYLMNPTKIDMAQILTPAGLDATDEGDLADESYREIIRIAVRNALGDIGSPQTQEAMQRNTEVE